jgi:hypothetical protein
LVLHVCFSQAVEAAESAVAVIQSRLLEALASRSDLAAEVAMVRRDADQERARLEMEVGQDTLIWHHFKNLFLHSLKFCSSTLIPPLSSLKRFELQRRMDPCVF